MRTFKEPNYTNVVLFLTGGEGVRITGLRLRGPDPERRTAQMEQWHKEGRYYALENSDGIRCGHAGLEVDNCELSGWTHAAVYLMRGAIRARIHHHNTFQATGVWAVVIRGRPAKQADIHHNWFLHPDPKKIVLQSNATGNMEVRRNLYGPSKLPMWEADPGWLLRPRVPLFTGWRC
jgi:hypothetical protein